MPGLIKAEDIASVKERTSIEDVVREHVTLRSAGVGALKGLCPFHDEKTPSFTVRPAVGRYHCFGCGESGDVLEFVQKVEHLTFTDAVERLAAKLGLELRYEDGKGPQRESLGRRSRLIEAHRVAREFYTEVLLATDRPEGRAGRDFLRERGFVGEHARSYGMGFAPRSGDALVRHLRDKGFSDDELILGGLAGRSSRGLYDRFRGRLMWPIADITGDTIGFGARRIFEDDRVQAKYLNTAETPIYKKSTVLYGLDRAKKAIARDRTAVVVEGYTDVMAAHESGVEGAVATCGTAFGADHITVLRRIMRDEADLAPARVIFTFDGDAAGQKAAMKAFEQDQRWASQSYVAVAADGMDPCDLRQQHGPEAVLALVEGAVPMFEFATRTTLARFDLETAEGRVQGMRAVAPIIASIRDGALRPEYVRTVAGWIGITIDALSAEVARADRAGAAAALRAEAERAGTGPGQPRWGEPGRGAAVASTGHEAADADSTHADVVPPPDLRNPVVVAGQQLLQCLVQFPQIIPARVVADLPARGFPAPAHRMIVAAVQRASADGAAGGSERAWLDTVLDAVPLAVQDLVSRLAVAPIPDRADPETGQPEMRYVESLVARVRQAAVEDQVAAAMSALRRSSSDAEPDADQVRAHSARLQELQRELADLKRSH